MPDGALFQAGGGKAEFKREVMQTGGKKFRRLDRR